MPERLVDTREKEGDRALDLTLRPKTLDEYIGQQKIKENLRIFMEAARQRGEPLEHVLLYGNAGLGKTTLAYIIANEVGRRIHITSGPALERAGDLAAILTNLGDGDILFIDEIHRLNKLIEEILYPAMEEFALDLVIGKGPGARTIRLDLPHFTLIGATTRVSLLSAPLRDRFGSTYHLDFYQVPDIEKIVQRSGRILRLPLETEAVTIIAKRARLTPRVANRLLKRVRDYAQVKGNGQATAEIAAQALAQLEVDEFGLDRVDRQILEIIAIKFNGGPVGLNTIAAATGEEIETIEEIYEPFLIQSGFLDRTPRGRAITKFACQILGLKNNQQESLL